MSETHALASEGAWVTLRDISELRFGDKRKVQAAITDPTQQMNMVNEMTGALIALMVVNWQLPEMLPLPSQDITVIDRLTIEDGNALEKLIEPVRERLFPGDPEPAEAKAQEEALKDPASPTAPSVDS